MSIAGSATTEEPHVTGGASQERSGGGNRAAGRGVSRVLVGAVAFGLAVAACSPAGGMGGGGPAEPTSFSVDLREPADLIPGQTNESEGAAVDALLFRGLTGYDDKTGRSVNLVARSVTSDDQQHWTIKIKNGWTFHDGEPVTAQSFAGAWNATVYNAWANSYFMTDLLAIKGATKVAKKKDSEMSGLKVVDDHTLKVNLRRPNSDFPLVVGYTAFFPMPESVLKSKNWKAYKAKPIGNGPYEMAEPWKHNMYIKLSRYDDYAGPGKGKTDEITFKIYSNPETAYNDVVAGNLDIARSIPPSRYGTAKQDFGDRYLQTPSSQFTYLGFPLWRSEFQDVRVRQAFSMAIDRKEIIKVLFNDTQIPARSLVTPLIKLGHRDDPCGKACEFNPVKAKRLLDEAGGFQGGTVTFWYNTGSGHDDWVHAVANQIHRNLRLDVKLKGQEWTQYLDTTNDHKQDGPYRLGWIMDYPGPYDYLGPLYATDGSSNNSGYSNDSVDEDLDKGISAKTPQRAVRHYHDAEDKILNDMPVIPLWFGTNQVVHTGRVTNLSFDALGELKLDQVEVTDR